MNTSELTLMIEQLILDLEKSGYTVSKPPKRLVTVVCDKMTLEIVSVIGTNKFKITVQEL